MHHSVILFLIDTLNVGGAERSLLDIVSRFRRYKPIICYIYPGDALKAEFEIRGIRTISLNIPPPYNWEKATRAVREVVEKEKPAIIHSSLFKSDIVSRRIAPGLGIPLINSMVNNTYHPSRFQGAGVIMYMKLKILQWLDAWTSRKVDLFISNSEAIRQSNSRALTIPLTKIKVIYRGRAVDDFLVDDAKAQNLRKELGIAPGKKVCLNVSRLLYRKGQMDLIRAFKTVATEDSNVILLIAGEGGYRADLEGEIQRLNLADRIRLLGSRADIPVLMKLADCFVFPSHYEGLPGVLIEAMFAKLPIVASRIPENLECVNEETAYLFNVRDEGGLASAIHAVLEKKQESISKAQKAHEVACEKFAISKIVERYETTYDELLFSVNTSAMRANVKSQDV